MKLLSTIFAALLSFSVAAATIHTDDRVKESTTTTGTGDVTLLGAPATFRTFSTVLADTNQCYYSIVHRTKNEWETGIGTFNAIANTITRTTVNAGTNGTSPVNFTAGTKDVSITITNAAYLAGGGGGGGGTVTSVGLSTNTSYLTVGSSPVNLSGTITLNKTTGLAANQVVATPDGSTGTADLRALVAGDIPNLAASKITSGQLATARGGTGLDTSTAANGKLLIGNGSGLSLANLTAGTNITITNGAGTITIDASGGGGGSSTIATNAQTGTTYTIDAADSQKLVTFSNASPVAVTLPQAGTGAFTSGYYFYAQNLGASVVTITPTTSTIDGAASLTFNQGQGCLIVSDGTNYSTMRGRPTNVAISSQVSGLAANVATFLGTPSSANLAAAVTDETGTGALVFANTPTLVAPVLGTPTSGTLTNCTGLPISTGISGLGAGVATWAATASSANLATAVTDETGTGALVFANTPTLVTPVLGTPTSGTLTNCTGLPISTGVSGLGAGVATWAATPSSANLATAVTDETGSGALVFATSPTLVTPIIGTPTSGTLTNCTGLPISTGVSGLGAGVATWAATPSSANLASAVTDETGSGALVFGTSPTLVTPVLGTPTSGTLTNCTGLPIGAGTTGTLAVDRGGTGQTSYTDGQLLIGNTTGNTLTKTTLTAGSGVTITNGSGSITIAASGASALPRGYIDGLITSRSSTTALGIATGTCRDSTNAADITCSSAITKTTSSWAAGTGNGGLDTGSIAANTWYHIYGIKKDSDGSFDGLISTSATSPTMPGGYTYFRRIGSAKTNGSSQWIAYFQLGDVFRWDVPIEDINVSSVGTSAVSRTLSVPTGIKVFPEFLVEVGVGTVNPYFLITALDQTDTAPSSTIYNMYALSGGTTSHECMFTNVWTNTSAQIRTRQSATGAGSDTFRISTQGWTDLRGKDQ